MIISKRSLLTAITMIFISTSLVVLSTSTQAKIKCWRNNDGIRECGENIPPEYSQQGYEKINNQGIRVEKLERALTKEEIQEQERLAAIQAEKDARKNEEDARNEILLDTYSDIDDIQTASDEKIASIDSEIALINARNKKIQDKLYEYTAAVKTANKELKKNLLSNMAKLRKQVNNNSKFVTERSLKQKEIKEEYAEKIERFRRLQKEK